MKEKGIFNAIFVMGLLISMAAFLFFIFPIDLDETYKGILVIYMLAVVVVFGIAAGFGVMECGGFSGIGRLLLISAVLLITMTVCCRYLDVVPSDIKDCGVHTFTALEGKHEITGGDSRKNYRKDSYYVTYAIQLENGEQISFSEKVSSDTKMKELVDKQDKKIKRVIEHQRGYYLFGNAEDTKEMILEELTGWTESVYLMAAVYAGGGILLLLAGHFQKKGNRAKQEAEWTLIIDGEEQEKVDWKSIEKAVMNLDVMEEEASVVLVRYMDSDKEEYLQFFADLDSEGELFFIVDRGICREEEQADYHVHDTHGSKDMFFPMEEEQAGHYVHNTDDLEEVKEIFRLYYKKGIIHYDQFEEFQQL